MLKYIKEQIRGTVRDDLYALLEEIDSLREDVNTLGKNMYDATFALAMATKISTKKLASQFDDKKLHAYVFKFQKDLDEFEALERKKKADKIAKKVANKSSKTLNKKS